MKVLCFRIIFLPFLATLCLGLVPALVPLAQDAPPPSPPPDQVKRPKIGLALSGGGARGAAHVGVLKVLEELHIKVDYIAGTSMGSCVGGLYATGMSPAEIEKTLEDMDWGAALSDNPPREDITFRKKEEDWIYQNRINLGYSKGRITIPGGFVEGQNLFFVMETLTLPVAGIDDFDRLPIPFRAVATDIVTGDRVVLSKGRLSEAIRASMAIPGVFSPAEIDGKLLVDGGMADNLPVDVCREMGADIVIAVDISTPLQDKDHVGNVLQVISQLTNFLTRRNMEPQLKNADVLLVPDLKGYGSGDFVKAGKIIPLGEVEARAKIPELQKLVIPEADYALWLARVRTRDTSPPTVDFVKVEGDVSPKIAEVMETKPGKVLDLPTLKKDINHLYGTAYFKRVDYRLTQDQGMDGITVTAKQKPWGPNYLRFGFVIQSNFQASSTFTLLAGLTKTRINSLDAEWRTDLQLGPRRILHTEFYQPIDRHHRWFVAPYGTYGERQENLYDGDSQVAQYRVDNFELGTDLGLNLGPCTEIRIGPVWSQDWGNRKVGNTILPGSFNVTDAGISGRFRVDTLDSASFPQEGTLFNLNAYFSREALGSFTNYDKLSLMYGKYAVWGKNILFVNLQGGTNLGSDIPAYATFSKGGMFSFGGYQDGQLRGQRFALGTLGYYHRLAKFSPSMGEGLFFGTWVTTGNTWFYRQPVTLDNMKCSLTLSLAADTIVGPIYVAFSQATGGNRKLYLSIGRSF
jgi:NTE family protein